MKTAPRLGMNYAKLWTANAVSNIGDGVSMAAGPLLVAALTSSPALVGGAVFVQELPYLLFSLISGAFVDRLDRKRLIVTVNVIRGAVLAVLALTIWSDTASVPILYAAVFLLGTGETLAENAAFSLLPAIVSDDALPRANARMTAAEIVGTRLAAPPFGAFLFVLAMALPFGFDAATFLLAALLISRLRLPAASVEPAEERGSLRADIVEGVRWLWGHQVLRMLALALALMNATLSGALGILVLYARDRLGLNSVGYGVLLTASAIGGLLGTAAVSRLQLKVRVATLLRVGLIVEAATHLVLALTTTPLVAGLTFLIFGVHTSIWGVLTTSLRQRVVPERLRGRVNSVYFLFSMTGSALGALLGGVIAQLINITAPFWIAFGVMIVITIVVWRPFGRATMDGPTADHAAANSSDTAEATH